MPLATMREIAAGLLKPCGPILRGAGQVTVAMDASNGNRVAGTTLTRNVFVPRVVRSRSPQRQPLRIRIVTTRSGDTAE